jgi:hypothetical protein
VLVDGGAAERLPQPVSSTMIVRGSARFIAEPSPVDRDGSLSACASGRLALLFEVMPPANPLITKKSVKFARPHQG